MKRVPEDDSAADAAAEEATATAEEEAVDPIVRGFVKDWDAMEDLLHHVLYTGLGWEMGNEGQILFTDPLCTPKVNSTPTLEKCTFFFFFCYLQILVFIFSFQLLKLI